MSFAVRKQKLVLRRISGSVAQSVYTFPNVLLAPWINLVVVQSPIFATSLLSNRHTGESWTCVWITPAVTSMQNTTDLSTVTFDRIATNKFDNQPYDSQRQVIRWTPIVIVLCFQTAYRGIICKMGLTAAVEKTQFRKHKLWVGRNVWGPAACLVTHDW